MKRPIVAVIGAAEASAREKKIAREVGALVAAEGWVLVTGGLGGVMEEASRGAHEGGGLVVGILPQGSAAKANPFVGIPIATNMGHARNVIIAHTADALIAIGGGMGTLSEIAIALKLGKPLFGIESHGVEGVEAVATAREAVEGCRRHLKS